MRSPKVFQVTKRVIWAGSSKIRVKNEGNLKCEDMLFRSSSYFRILAYFMRYVYKFLFESEQCNNFGGILFLSDFG